MRREVGKSGDWAGSAGIALALSPGRAREGKEECGPLSTDSETVSESQSGRGERVAMTGQGSRACQAACHPPAPPLPPPLGHLHFHSAFAAPSTM